jgi:hypothetical protein
MFIVQGCQSSQCMGPRGGIFLLKWCSSFAGNSDGKMNVQSAYALNIRYMKGDVLHRHLHGGLEGNQAKPWSG